MGYDVSNINLGGAIKQWATQNPDQARWAIEHPKAAVAVLALDVRMAETAVVIKELGKAQDNLDAAFKQAMANTTNPYERQQLQREYAQESRVLTSMQQGAGLQMQSLKNARSTVIQNTVLTPPTFPFGW